MNARNNLVHWREKFDIDANEQQTRQGSDSKAYALEMKNEMTAE